MQLVLGKRSAGREAAVLAFQGSNSLSRGGGHITLFACSHVGGRGLGMKSRPCDVSHALWAPRAVMEHEALFARGGQEGGGGGRATMGGMEMAGWMDGRDGWMGWKRQRGSGSKSDPWVGCRDRGNPPSALVSPTLG